MKSKLLKVTGLLFACFALFISCTTPVAEPGNEEKKKETTKVNFVTKNVDYNIQTIAAVLGNVNKILDTTGSQVNGSGVVNRSAARFVNGEELYLTYPNTLTFYAYLVEYNEFTNSDVLNWMETNEFNSVKDCSFHQNYNGVTIDSQKKYVEVCSYVDANNKAIYCEIRIHYPRNNQATDDSGKYYSKSCFFDPTFTIDTNAGKTIKTKEEAIYVYGDGWNEGVNPWAGKKFSFVSSEYFVNGVQSSSTPEVEISKIQFKDDDLIINESLTFRYFWNAKYKCLYMLGFGLGCPGRWELNGNQLKYIYGIKIDSEEHYQYTYYELIQ